MPKGPRGERRPADVIGGAILVAKISVGEMDEDLAPPSGRVLSGRAGARARTISTTPEERSAIARQGAAARWSKRA